MGHSSFGPMWPTRNSNIVTLVRVDGLRLPIHKELADLVAMLMDLTEMMGYDIVPGWTWGFAFRPISGTKKPSNHSQGTAVDVNAPMNPYASAAWHRANNSDPNTLGRDVVTDIPEDVIRLWMDHGFNWGGLYNTKPDTMHLEFLHSVATARAITQRLRSFLAGEGSPAPAAPAHQPRKGFVTVDLRMLKMGDKGGDVKSLQALLNGKTGSTLKIDGDFGKATNKRVRDVQTFLRLGVDGIVGKQTWGVLFL